LGSDLCCALHGIQSFNSNYSSVLESCTLSPVDTCSSSPPTSKVIFLEAQMGCAAGMLLVCCLYVIAYIFACFGICFGHD